MLGTWHRTAGYPGPPGAGKTRPAIASAREAVQGGYTALFVSAPAQAVGPARAHADRTLGGAGRPLRQAQKLPVVDEPGYPPFAPNAAHLFFPLVSRRYERGSLRITGNRNAGEWGRVFGDAAVATAILERLLHHGHPATIRRESYRLKEKRRAGVVVQHHAGFLPRDAPVVSGEDVPRAL